MLKNQLCVTNSKILHEILYEIKKELNFDLIFHDDFVKEKIINIDKENFKNVIFLVINNLKINSKEQIESSRILNLEKLPIKILKLIEKINIFFLRVNFKSQSNIFIKSYELNLNSRIISKNKKILKLTEKEILVILFLFNANNPKNVNDLQKEVWKQKLTLETHTVETHIYRLRQKFLKVFNDKFFILSRRLGYSI
tara:strand:+ start:472 stop:1062 length:591 start_codon:yes stop_codon:yes gene_type:complete